MTRTSFAFLMAMLVLLSNPALGQDVPEDFSFFITSEGPGNGGNLGGLAGADRHCNALADPVGFGYKEWRAYLSTWLSGSPALHARNRIGPGPWHNVRGELIAENVEDLHSDNNNLNKQSALNEKGVVVNGRGDEPNRHDILTGSNADGTATEIDDQFLIGHVADQLDFRTFEARRQLLRDAGFQILFGFDGRKS